ncbi:Retrotransposon gag protein [Gossypium australe]|uniref:Retrotransposon gag protein n=1 Tax=Gossypium australe TaxID=47621 RepID=A0A5B6W7B4_9ROSI|nr:Retrotransposon gag protein [Gossypium australe]
MNAIQESIIRSVIAKNNFEIKLTKRDNDGGPKPKVKMIRRQQDQSRHGTNLQKFFCISSFVEGKNFHQAWEQFKLLIQRCRCHDLPERLGFQMFYNGLDANSRSRLDGVVGVSLMN